MAAELPNKDRLPALHAQGLTMREIAEALGPPWTPVTVMIQRRKMGLPKRERPAAHWRQTVADRHWLVWAMFNDGKKPGEIADATGLSYGYVLRILKGKP